MHATPLHAVTCSQLRPQGKALPRHLPQELRREAALGLPMKCMLKGDIQGG